MRNEKLHERFSTNGGERFEFRKYPGHGDLYYSQTQPVRTSINSFTRHPNSNPWERNFVNLQLISM